jgi:hypothetical protein
MVRIIILRILLAAVGIAFVTQLLFGFLALFPLPCYIFRPFILYEGEKLIKN